MSRIDKKADPAAETEPLFSTRLFLNAVMHRDYSGPAGHVALAIFGDPSRSERRVASVRDHHRHAIRLPHLSKPRNPLIADAFQRTGAVEIWGRGTNREIEACRWYSVARLLDLSVG